MSSLYAGGVSANLIGPYVYLIRARDLLYVGETQKHPVVRWCDHLGPRGSFRTAVFSRGEVELDPDERITFHAYQVAQAIEGLPKVQIKQATQAVEHALHGLLRARPSLLGRVFRVISDTEKTAPRTFRSWELAESVAETIAGEFGVALACGAA